MKKWKPRVVIAGIIVVASMALTAVGVDTYITGMGMLAAGYLFGTMPKL